MTKAVVFQTPGLIDLRSLNTFGVNSKPNTNNPIGYFGTGLKYAVAVLVRTGHKVTIYRGLEHWAFRVNEEDFRDKKFGFIETVLVNKRISWGRAKKLPFTTELGKNWGLWQAFRELYSNTLDEHGNTYCVDNYIGALPLKYDATQIVVEGDDFVQEFHDRAKTFLGGAPKERIGTAVAEHFNKPGDAIYYRGIKVRTLKEPSLVTYNILSDITLTEDRTNASDYQVDQLIMRYITEHDDRDLINRALDADKESYEGNLNWSFHGSPGTTFHEVMQERKPKSLPNPTWGSYYKYYVPEPKPAKKIVTQLNWKTSLAKALEEGDDDTMLDIITNYKEPLIKLLYDVAGEQHAADEYEGLQPGEYSVK